MTYIGRKIMNHFSEAKKNGELLDEILYFLIVLSPIPLLTLLLFVLAK